MLAKYNYTWNKYQDKGAQYGIVPESLSADMNIMLQELFCIDRQNFFFIIGSRFYNYGIAIYRINVQFPTRVTFFDPHYMRNINWAVCKMGIFNKYVCKRTYVEVEKNRMIWKKFSPVF